MITNDVDHINTHLINMMTFFLIKKNTKNIKQKKNSPDYAILI